MKRALSIVTALCIMLCGGLPMSADEKNEKNEKNSKKQIALTFDDGPSERYTSDILDLLAKYKVRATFFLVGSNVCISPELVKRQAAEGHELGNHTFTHPHMKDQSIGSLESELKMTSDVIFAACGKRPILFRPPEGVVSDAVSAASDELGYRRALWTIDTMDWAHRSKKEIVDSVLGSAKDGSIVLMHDYIVGESHTREALEVIIPTLIEKGFTFVTVSELK